MLIDVGSTLSGDDMRRNSSSGAGSCLATCPLCPALGDLIPRWPGGVEDMGVGGGVGRRVEWGGG